MYPDVPEIVCTGVNLLQHHSFDPPDDLLRSQHQSICLEVFGAWGGVPHKTYENLPKVISHDVTSKGRANHPTLSNHSSFSTSWMNIIVIEEDLVSFIEGMNSDVFYSLTFFALDISPIFNG